jgi:hypothetical protein
MSGLTRAGHTFGASSASTSSLGLLQDSQLVPELTLFPRDTAHPHNVIPIGIGRDC